MIDGILSQLRAFDDRTLRSDIQKKPAEVAKLVKDYFYCG
jgi:glutamine synthetase